MKPHNPIQLYQLAEQTYRTWCVTIDTTRVPVTDLFRPQYWVACTILKKNDLIRCIANDGSYDFLLKVETHNVIAGKNAVTVARFPKEPDALIEAAFGEAAAEMVPTTINGKPVPRVERTPKGARLIGFDGAEVSSHDNEAAANAALGDYLAAYKITAVADRVPVDARTGEVVPAKPAAAQSVTAPVKPSIDTNISPAKRKEIAKREARKAKQAEADAANKARSAERLAAELAEAAETL